MTEVWVDTTDLTGIIICITLEIWIVVPLIFFFCKCCGERPQPGYVKVWAKIQTSKDKTTSKNTTNNSKEIELAGESGEIAESSTLPTNAMATELTPEREDDIYYGAEWTLERSMLSLPRTRGTTYFLAITRLTSFGFFLYNAATSPQWYYFTIWCLAKYVLYYLLSSIMSLVGIWLAVHDDSSNNDNNNSGGGDSASLSTYARSMIWLNQPLKLTNLEKLPHWFVTLGRFQYFLYNFSGASAFFVTVVAFSLLNPDFAVRNASVHFATSLSFVLEMVQNQLYVRAVNIILFLVWLYVYLVFIWPFTAQGHLIHWPYNFLDVSTAACFAWYNALFILSIIFYYIWYGLNRIKYALWRRRKNNGK